MLLDVGILLGIYIGVRLLENKGKPLKTQKLTKAKISPVKSVAKKNFIFQAITKRQPLLKNIISNDDEKNHDFYLKISSASIGLAAIANFFPVFHLFSLGIIAYTSMPILRQTEKAFKERKIGHHLLLLILIVLALSTGQLFALTLTILFYHLGKKNLAKIQDKSSKKIFTHLFEQQSQKVWRLKDQVEIEVPLEEIQVNDIVVVNTGETVPIDEIRLSK